jgi:outer membrane protein assembly factor BamB
MATAKKSAVKKGAVKKGAVKKAAVKKAAQRAPVKKAAVKKGAVKKAAKKGAVKKAAVKKGAVKRAAVKKPAAKKGPKPKPFAAPTKWLLQTSDSAFGIHVGADAVWVSNDKGDVHVTDLAGEVQRSLKLPHGAKCILADEHWIYAGTDKGVVYDLTGNVPRAVYQVDSSADILWMDMYQGNLCVADDNGGLTVYDPSETLLWSQRDKTEGSMWFVRADRRGVFSGGYRTVRAFDWAGVERWRHPTKFVLFGWQEADTVFAAYNQGITVLDKDSGAELTQCKGSSFPSCAAAPGGALVFGGSWDDMIYCYDREGALLWIAETGCGSAVSMQFRDGLLYIVTSDGALACIDVSDEAIAKAREGAKSKPSTVKAPKLDDSAAEETTRVETTTEVGDGVLAERFSDKGKLRVRVLSDGYRKDWFCQFPRDIREKGVKYVVDKVLEATQGGFYRALGNIRRLE